MAGADLARTVTAARRTRRAPSSARRIARAVPALRVAVYDFGLKRNILRMAAAAGLEATVVPAETPPADVLAGGFEGVVLSNGPGDPAATRYGVDAAAGLLGRVPLFGICLGHQSSRSRWAGGPTRCRSATGA